MTKRRSRHPLHLAPAALLFAAAVSFGGSSEALAQASNRPLVIARNMDLNSLDPHRSFCDTCQIYNSTVYETLLTLDANNKLVPLLAASWEGNADQTKFTFKLDTKAKFSDGSPLEAKDVKWSWERLKNIKGSAAFLVDNVTNIETPDAQTVVVTMASSNSEFLNIVSAPYMAIMNSKVAGANGAQAGADAATKDNAEGWFLQNSAGSGPYVLTSYSPNNELRLKRNPQYWRASPAIDDVVFRQVKDAVAQAQMLESGAADIAMQIDPDTAKTIKSPNVTVTTVPSYNFIYLALSPGAKGNKVKMTKEVREAISMGLNRKDILEFTVGKEGQIITAPIPIGFPGGNGFPEPAYDPAKAKDMLAKANVGNLELDAAFPNLNAYGIDLSLLMQKVQQDLSKINVKVNLQPMTFANWREQVSGNGIPLTAVFYAPDYYGSAQYVEYFGMMPNSPWAKRAGAANDPSVINPREADLLKKALASSGEEAARIYHEIGLEMINDKVILPLVSPNLILAHGKGIKGVRYSACCNLPVAEISR
jgi:peptide/nickel transport system substrate-binding protein